MSSDAADGPVPSHLVMLNPEQYKAVTTIEGPLLILAGAGSGKTRVLTRRIAHLLHKGVDPKNILAVTFTNKAAAEMKERIAELVGEAGERVWVSTFHSSCARILRSEIEALGWTRRFAIYDDDDQLRVLKEILKRRGLETEKTSAKDFLGRIDYHKTRMQTPDLLVAQMRSHVNSTLLSIWREYEENLKAADAVDFNDLITLTVRLFREHPDVLAKWRERFQYVMVDEYQDTNQQQYELLRALCPDSSSNLGVVGDDDQSIYGFRGADVSNILNFEQDYPEATVIKLEQNYRCSGNILKLSNVVVARNSNRRDKRLWTDADPGAQVKLVLCSSPHDEADRVATAIQKAHTQLGYSYDDVAIIYRTNATSRLFEQALTVRGIQTRIVGGRKFYERREVRDVLGFLRLVINPNDDAALLRVINVPSRGIGPKAIQTLRNAATERGVPLLAAARGLVGGKTGPSAKVGAFVEMMDEITSRAQTAPLPDLVAHVLERTGYLASLQVDKKDGAEKRLENLRALIEATGEFQPPEDTHLPMDILRAWLDRVALAGQTDEMADDGKVTLMTVHCAKGLEYPVVFVVHMMDGIFPHARSMENDLDEERRLAYVAFTRAKQLLFVTRSRTMPQWSSPTANGGWKAPPKPASPSTFLFDLPQDATTGDLPVPDLDEEETVDPVARKRERASAFLRTHSQYHTEHEPEEGYTLVEVTELEQLSEGTRVRHPRKGFGVIRSVTLAGSIPRVRVAFGGPHGRTATVPGTELEIVVE